MVRAWYMEGNGLTNPRDEHQQLPPKFVTLEDLYTVSGVEHQALNVDTYKTDGTLQTIKEERGFGYEDILETPDGEELKEFYREHLHEDDEMRFVLHGCGYYDVRDDNDEWIRVEVVAGDLIIVPGGCYHRFMLDHKNKFKARRFFKNDSRYKAYNRPADNMNCRLEYLQKLQDGSFQI